MHFSDVETEFLQLKAQFDAGELSEEDLKARLHELMIQDAQGRWWMIGYETGGWYCYQDEQWIPAEPPAAEVAPAPAAIPAQPPGKLAWQSLLLVIAGWSLNFWIVSEVDFWIFLYPHPELGLAWFLAGLATGAALRWAEPAIRWSDALWIACVWGLGALLLFIMPLSAGEDYYVGGVGLFLVLLGGGLACVWAVWRAGRVVRWYHVLVVTLAWALAIIAAVLIFVLIIDSPQSYPGPPLISALLGALVGGIGGGASLWQLSRAGYTPRYQPAPASHWPARLPGALAGERGCGILVASTLLLVLAVAGVRQYQLSGLGAPSGVVLAKLNGHTDFVRSAIFSTNGLRVLTTSQDGTARLWQADTGDPLFELRGHSGPLTYAAFNPGSRWVVTTSEDGTARIWSVDDSKSLFELLGNGTALNHAAFSPGGGRLAAAGEDGSVQVWQTYTGNLVMELAGDGEALDRVAFSPDEKWLVASSDDRTLVWDASNGELAATLINTIPQAGPAFTPDSSRVLTATGWDGEWRLWKLPEGIPVSSGTVEGYPLVAALSPDGKYLAVSEGNYDHVELWALEPSAQRVAFLRGHKGPVRSLEFSTDGKWLVTASDDGTARVWEVATLRLVSVLDTHIGYLTVAAFSRDGERVITQGTANSAWIWQVGSQ